MIPLVSYSFAWINLKDFDAC